MVEKIDDGGELLPLEDVRFDGDAVDLLTTIRVQGLAVVADNPTESFKHQRNRPSVLRGRPR